MIDRIALTFLLGLLATVSLLGPLHVIYNLLPADWDHQWYRLPVDVARALWLGTNTYLVSAFAVALWRPMGPSE